MSRDVQVDFKEYQRYLESFSYSAVLAQPEYVLHLRQIHLAFLSLLTLCSELTEPGGDAVREFEAEYGDLAKAYLREVVSDVGQSVHCWGQGAYKASLVTLRSAIESHAKCFALKAKPEVLTQKAVHLVFDIAKGAPYFIQLDANTEFAKLLGVYDGLNLYVHTVTDAAMFQYMSLGVFPQYNTESAKKIAEYIQRVVNSMLFGSVMVLRKSVFKIHHRNRDVILAALTPSQRQSFNNAADLA